MFTESVELYDIIYGRMKDYAADAAKIAALLARERPGARTVLDVACGTGEHAMHLGRDYGLAVDGIDLEPRFVEIARRKNPGAAFHVADMMRFDLGRRYDAVLCLFSSIGYARTLDGVAAALRCFRAHVGAGGVIVVEPWYRPDQFEHGRIRMNTVETEELLICRMSRSEVEGRLSRLRLEYLVGRPDGFTRATEDHTLGLFTDAEMRDCFRAAGLACDYDPVGLMGRGLYVARVA